MKNVYIIMFSCLLLSNSPVRANSTENNSDKDKISYASSASFTFSILNTTVDFTNGELILLKTRG